MGYHRLCFQCEHVHFWSPFRGRLESQATSCSRRTESLRLMRFVFTIFASVIFPHALTRSQLVLGCQEGQILACISILPNKPIPLTWRQRFLSVWWDKQRTCQYLDGVHLLSCQIPHRGGAGWSSRCREGVAVTPKQLHWYVLLRHGLALQRRRVPPLVNPCTETSCVESQTHRVPVG